MTINTSLSNLYAERASSEHPTALWMLSEDIDYVSQITEEERQFQLFATWQIVNGEGISESSQALNAPFTDSSTTRIRGEVPSGPTQDIILRSQFTLSRSNFAEELANFSVGFYTFIETALADTISIGYQYTDAQTEQVVEVLEEFDIKKSFENNWKFFTATFPLFPEAEEAEDVKLLIKMKVFQSGLSGDYDFLINGLSVGQWSEEFQKSSYGVTPDDIPGTINLPSVFGALPAFPYGASGQNGYYLSRNKILFCKNFGVPLVYGSSNITKISPNFYNNVSYPSVIFPGYGFLNNRGKNNTYTVEMWLRINSSSGVPRKIFGPITGSDGLYADGSFITFKVGDVVGSHYVGEWFRPMLIHLRIIEGSVIVLLNGEEVIDLTFDVNSTQFPSEFATNGKNQDWIGFYAYDDVSPIDLDSFSIYSYAMPTPVAKRRWVWGQAVTPPEQTNSALNAITAYNDYAFSNYAVNYNYPDFANWNQAFFSNVNANDRTLTLPEYNLPNFVLNDKTLKNLYDETKQLVGDGVSFLTLKPNNTWTNSTDFIYFEKLGILNEKVESVYGVFETDGTAVNQPLFKITNKNNNDNIIVLLNGTTIRYLSNISGVTSTISTQTISANSMFAAGINIKKISLIQDLQLGRFFTDQSNLDVALGGDGFAKFTGKIYRFGFDAGYNNRKIQKLYDNNGIFYTKINFQISNVQATNGNITYTISNPHSYEIGDSVTISGVVSSSPTNAFNLSNQQITSITNNSFTIRNPATGTYVSGGTVTDNTSKMLNHTANYTLTAINKYGILFADIAAAGYWEDYMPLKYFGKDIADSQGNLNYELDFIQFNQDYPEPATALSTEETSTWTYADLFSQYADLDLRYSDLANSFYTGWQNYQDMSENSVIKSFYNTKTSQLRSFISFQRIADGANTNLIDFNNYAPAFTDGVIDPIAFESDWEDTAYEITTGSIIYPPKVTNNSRAVRFSDLAIVYHLDFKSEGILHHPINFKELQLASKVLERTDFTPAGSKFGVPVLYYAKKGINFDFKLKNPIATYKRSTPHLYLNKQSGWKIKGRFDSTQDRGLSIPVNISRANNTEVSSIQMWIRFAESEFPANPVRVLSVSHNDAIYDFFLQADVSGQRGTIFGVNTDTNEVLDELLYYINGLSVGSPYFINEEWSVLGIEFPIPLKFNNRLGSINLNGPLTYNNVSYSLATNIEKDETLEVRTWASIVTNTSTVNIVNATFVDGKTIYTTDVPHKFGVDIFLDEDGEVEDLIGDLVKIEGISPSGFNAEMEIVEIINETQFAIQKNTSSITYSSGGTAKTTNWRSVPNSLAIIDNSPKPYTWRNVKIINESRFFNVDLNATYAQYTGSNRIIVDDPSSGILVKPDNFRFYNEVSWINSTKVPA